MNYPYDTTDSGSMRPLETNDDTTVLQAALDWYDAGVNVLPARGDGSKAPAVNSWRDFQHNRVGTRDRIPDLIGSYTGVVVITGRVWRADSSGYEPHGIECFEFDTREALDAFLSGVEAAGLSALVDRIRTGYEEMTPSGGVHWFYTCDIVEGNQKLAATLTGEQDANGKPKIKTAIETRGQGGLAVVAPSHGGVHPTGKPYIRTQGSPSTVAHITPEERAALFAYARSFDRTPAESRVFKASGGKVRRRGPRNLRARFNRHADWGRDILAPRGWQRIEGTNQWRRPGAHTDGHDATTDADGTDRMWVFSTSAGLDTDRYLTKFEVFATLYHNGDVEAAAADLREHWTPNEGYSSSTSATTGSLEITDFYAYLPQHKYIHRPTREIWDKAGVNAAVAPMDVGDSTIPASVWLDTNRPIHQMTWVPGAPEILEDVVMREGGLQPYSGARIYNTYVAPTLDGGDATQAGPWVDHVKRLYPDDWRYIVAWYAHRVQHPGEKINHGIVLGGAPGIGKDAMLEPVTHAVGPWNVGEVSPSVMGERFNPYLQNVILRISEARDLGETDRYGFYERSKTMLAAPPETIRIDAKYMPEYRIPNVVGVIFTTNHRTGALYLPADDRRHYVAWSNTQATDFDAGYFDRLFGWYAAGGLAHVRAYLAAFDLSTFNAKAPPPKTDAFWAMVDAERTPEEGELADLLDRLGTPHAVTLETLKHSASNHGFNEAWSILSDRKARRRVPHLLRSVGYRPVRNKYADDGMWRIQKKRQAVYARESLPVNEQLAAAQRLVEGAGVSDVGEVSDLLSPPSSPTFSYSDQH